MKTADNNDLFQSGLSYVFQCTASPLRERHTLPEVRAREHELRAAILETKGIDATLLKFVEPPACEANCKNEILLSCTEDFAAAVRNLSLCESVTPITRSQAKAFARHYPSLDNNS